MSRSHRSRLSRNGIRGPSPAHFRRSSQYSDTDYRNPLLRPTFRRDYCACDASGNGPNPGHDWSGYKSEWIECARERRTRILSQVNGFSDRIRIWRSHIRRSYRRTPLRKRGKNALGRLCSRPGAMSQVWENRAIACDHYRRGSDDLDHIAAAGSDAYRFSTSWTRIMPEVRGSPIPQGIASYDRIIDGMLSRGILPFLTLYHWQLPSPLADPGGWQNRDIAGWFGDDAETVPRVIGTGFTPWRPSMNPGASPVFHTSLAGMRLELGITVPLFARCITSCLRTIERRVWREAVEQDTLAQF